MKHCWRLLFSFSLVCAPNTQAGIWDIPERSKSAKSGSEFLRATSKFTYKKREEAIFKEIVSGNIPDYLRNLSEVTIRQRIGKREYTGKFLVMPDYLAIGSNEDFVRIPMGWNTARRIAQAVRMLIPTPKMVDSIAHTATTKLDPQPMLYNKLADSNAYYAGHHALIQGQLGFVIPQGIISGHKKDIVQTNQLLVRSGQVAIYGWHKPNGTKVQPLSLVHEEQYADYSHGVRLVDNVIMIDDQPQYLDDVLSDHSLAVILSREGALKGVLAVSDHSVNPLLASMRHLPPFDLIAAADRHQGEPCLKLERNAFSAHDEIAALGIVQVNSREASSDPLDHLVALPVETRFQKNGNKRRIIKRVHRLEGNLKPGLSFLVQVSLPLPKNPDQMQNLSPHVQIPNADLLFLGT